MRLVYVQIKQLTEELQAAVVEKERLLADRSELMEKMNTDVTSLTEERNELQERLQQLERDGDIMKTHLEEKEQRVSSLYHSRFRAGVGLLYTIITVSL